MRRGCEVLVEVDDVHAGGARKRRQVTAGVRCVRRKIVMAGDGRDVVIRRTVCWCGEVVLVVVSALAVADLARPFFSSANHMEPTIDIRRRPSLRSKVLQLGKDYI